jgi:hypothetical protein
MYQAPRYPIWMNEESDPFESGARIGTALSGMRHNFAQANLTDQETQNQPLLRQGYDLSNQHSALVNQYYPQERDVELSKAASEVDKNNRLGQRFGTDYAVAKAIQILPSAAKANLLQNIGPEYGDYYSKLYNASMNGGSPSGALQQGASGGSSGMAASILKPYIDKRTSALQGDNPSQAAYSDGPPAGSYQPPMMQAPASYQAGLNGQPLTQSGLVNNGAQNPNIDPGLSKKVADAVSTGAATDYANKVYTSAQKGRIDAGDRFQVAMSQVMPKLDSAAQYAGAPGQAGLLLDKVSAGAGKYGQQYTDYVNTMTGLDTAKAELFQVLGKRNTDSGMKEVDALFPTPDSLKTNPELFKAQVAEIQELESRIHAINKQPLAERVKQDLISEQMKIPDGKRNGVSWINGRAYTPKMLDQKIAQLQSSQKVSK